MKKLFKSNGFLAAALSTACLGILGLCLYVSLDRKNSFEPEAAAPAASTQEWVESASKAAPYEEKQEVPVQKTEKENVAKEDYPKVVEESAKETVVEFTSSEKAESAPPPAPEGKTVSEDTGEDHPVNPAPEAEKEATGGTRNESGAVYDPVFGWIVPGSATQSAMDSTGSPDKMVGNMGN